jgi:hypothetical protein
MLVAEKLVSNLLFCFNIGVNIISETDGDFWNDKTGINMTAQEIEAWTLEGL